jgi:hypothetical protein
MHASCMHDITVAACFLPLYWTQRPGKQLLCMKVVHFTAAVPAPVYPFTHHLAHNRLLQLPGS